MTERGFAAAQTARHGASTPPPANFGRFDLLLPESEMLASGQQEA